MKTPLYSLLILIALAVAATVVTWQMSRPIFDDRLTSDVRRMMEVAPLDAALTFARTSSGNVILVTGATDAAIQGVDLGRELNQSFDDAIDAYHAIGREQLLFLAGDASYQAYAWEDLALPVNERYPHVAAGTNYQAHAEEVGHDGEPFLFPKLSHTTAWNADVVDGDRLDYEVELCAVPLTDHTSENRADLGYLLCGDFTDRWALVVNIDQGEPMGQTGFPVGKGGDTRFPVGALFVIPRTDDFYESFDIALYVNDELRQRSSASLMIWPPYQILSRAMADCESPYDADGQVIHVSACDTIPARTMILTGTPEGVLFQLATVWNPLAYLSAGDVVVSTGTYLGYMRNEVIER
jgi:2,4-diketo-3-deoxy-L-fuconate hydrolase